MSIFAHIVLKIMLPIMILIAVGFIRLLLSPLLGYLIVVALGVKGTLAQSMVIGVATPTAVNTAILALQ
jgi:predicted permease